MKQLRMASVVVDFWMGKALELAEEAVQQGHFDPLGAKQSCVAGLAYLNENQSLLAKKYPGFELDELEGLPGLCDRISDARRSVADGRHWRDPNATAQVATALASRRKLLAVAQALSISGKVPTLSVARIRSGRGQVDQLQDVLALVVLLSPHQKAVEVLCGQGALDSARRAAKSAQEALGTQVSVSPQTRKSADLRDRYATLIIQGHDRLRAAVAAISSYRKAAQIVAPLSTRAPKKSKALPGAPDAPAANPS